MIQAELVKDLKGKSILITGGSGFFGKNLCESLNSLGMTVYAMARNPIKMDGVHFVQQDVTKPFLFDAKVDFIIHAATPAVREDTQLEQTMNIIVNGTQQVLNFAERINCSKFLLVSSGAVYGEQPENIEKIPEDYTIKESFYDFKSAYATGKRISELMALDWARRMNKHLTIARCFAFSGRHLPLDQHFAIGNFVGDALRDKVINIKGDGSALRSYMDADDLVIWLITILLRGKNGEAYNVGSDVEISIKDLANKIAEKVPGTFLDKKVPGTYRTKRNKYIPSIEKAHKELGLKLIVTLDESIQKMIDFNRG